ncbi:hypothetical protein Mapa_011823 [Marchantia paleacea]|nr:hypothetical protein Mapa_011823 [Marchantia paleacea]
MTLYARRMTRSRCNLMTLALAILLVASTACRAYPIDSSSSNVCDIASNMQTLLPCMSVVLGPSDPTGGQDENSGCCSALKALADQDVFIDCLCTRFDSKPDSCKEALRNIRC